MTSLKLLSIRKMISMPITTLLSMKGATTIIMAAAAVMAMRIMIVQQDHHHSHHVVDVEVEVVVDEAEVEAVAEEEDVVVVVVVETRLESSNLKNTLDRMDMTINSLLIQVRTIPNTMTHRFTPSWQNDYRQSFHETFVPPMRFKWS
jgi:hypothetical protein